MRCRQVRGGKRLAARLSMGAALALALALGGAAPPTVAAPDAPRTAGEPATRSAAPTGAGPATSPGALPGEGWVSLNLPENMELKALLDYASKRLGMNIIYQDDQVANQHLTIKSPGPIPASSLPALVQGLLKAKGLVLVDAEEPGWKRVVPLAAAAVPATQPGGGGGAGGAPAVIQVFSLEHIDAQRADLLIKPLLSGPAASSLGSSEQHLLIVTDYPSNVARIAELVRRIDQPPRGSRVRFVPVLHADPAQLAPQVRQIVVAETRTRAGAGQATDTVEVTADKRSGQLVLIGPQDLLDEAAQIARSLDVPVSEQQSPVRFYKLANATAADVLDTIRSLEGEQPAAAGGAAGRAATNAAPPGLIRAGAAESGLSRPPGYPEAAPAGVARNSGAPATASPGAGTGAASAASPYRDATPAVRRREETAATPPAAAGEPSAAGASGNALRTANATVAADVNTNTIIVVAEPAVQRIYEQLIRQLDKRRPQVLVECTIATLDTTHDFTLGVELGAHGKPGTHEQVVTFSNFGLSTPNPATGQLSLIPGLGFNGAIVNSSLAEVIVRALSADSRSRITSAPRILVNDNATGTLSSQAAFPTTATNIANTIATTSFQDYATAGTTITLTPHISEADYLQLEYSVTLSSFTGPGNNAQGIPPPKQEDTVASKITVPDGSTVIVGGLNRSNFNSAVDRVPLLGDVPVLKELFSSRSRTDERVTLFVFLRPIILRDDQFEDLKFLSERDLKAAGLPTGWPASEPLAVR